MILYQLYEYIIGFYGFGRISARFGPKAADRQLMKQISDFSLLLENFFMIIFFHFLKLEYLITFQITLLNSFLGGP